MAFLKKQKEHPNCTEGSLSPTWSIALWPKWPQLK